jgi:hypothetical protein
MISLHTGSLFACNSQLSIIVICANLRIFHSGRRKRIFYFTERCRVQGELLHHRIVEVSLFVLSPEIEARVEVGNWAKHKKTFHSE